MFDEFKDMQYYTLIVVLECLTTMIEYGELEPWEKLDRVVADLKIVILGSDMFNKDYKCHRLKCEYESLLKVKAGLKITKHKKIVHKVMLDNLYRYGIINFSDYSQQLEKIQQKML